MRLWHCGLIALAAVALQSVALAQGNMPAPVPFVPAFVSLKSVPVPYDPLEAVISGAQEVMNAEERAAALDLLAKAQRLSNVRRHPYDLKTTFTSYGSSPSDGRWILEDTSPGAFIYLWTAQGPSFSGIFLNADKLLSSNQPGGAIPLRLAQVRRAMWSVYYPANQRFRSVRVANGELGGAAVRCVLLAPFFGSSEGDFASGRSFMEAEYCVNTQTGLLELFSPCAGLYFKYDYANASHFHEETIPGGFTITERGKTIIEAKTESVGDAPPKDSSLFQPAGLTPLGVGQVTSPPSMTWAGETSHSLAMGAASEAVVVHGMLSPDHQLSETEVLASTNPAVEQEALEFVSKVHPLRNPLSDQPGTTPRYREFVLIVQFRAPMPPRPQGMGPGVVSVPRGAPGVGTFGDGSR